MMLSHESVKFETRLFLLILLFSLFFIPQVVATQNAPDVFYNYNFRVSRLSSGDGVDINSHRVRAITQDRNGFMWFGSWNGILKYDGSSYTRYINDPKNPESLSGNTVTFLHEDAEGLIWAGTVSEGLSVLNPRTEKFTRYYHSDNDPASLVGNIPVCIYEENENTLWIGTFTSGVSRYDKDTGEFTSFSANSSDERYRIPANTIRAITSGSDGTIIVLIHNYGFVYINSDTNEVESVPDENVGAVHWGQNLMYTDEDGHVWAHTDDYLLQIDSGKRKSTIVYQFPKGSKATGLSEDQNGNIWMVGSNTSSGGLSRFDKKSGRVTKYKHSESDPFSPGDDIIFTVYVDRSNHVWAGLGRGGADHFEAAESKFTLINSHPLAEDDIMGVELKDIATDRQGNLWVLTDIGVTQFDPQMNFKASMNISEDLRQIGYTDSIQTGASLEIWPDGKIWIAGSFILNYSRMNGELLDDEVYPFISKGSTWELINAKGSTQELIARDTLIDGNDAYMTTSTGLIVYNRDDKVFSQYLPQPDHPEDSANELTSLYQDPANNDIIWISTWYTGIYSFNKKTRQFTNYKNERENLDSLTSNEAYTVARDKDGTLWIGTNNGLNRMDEKGFEYFNEEKGFLSLSVYTIIPGEKGSLWVGTNQGLYHYNFQKQSYIHYGMIDGLQGNNFHGGSGYVLPDGRGLMGGPDGINVFSLEAEQNSRNNPKAFISQILLNDFNDAAESLGIYDDNLKIIDSLSVDKKDNSISLYFAYPVYHRREEYHYQYMLEGLDEGWRKAAPDKMVASYSNLPKGDYRFLVRMTDQNGSWNDPQILLDLTVKPAWWETRYAFASYVLVILALTILINQISQRKVIRKNKELEIAISQRTEELHAALIEAEAATKTKSDFLANMSHEIRTPMNAIIGLNSLLDRTEMSKKQRDYVNKIRISARNLLGIINDILDYSKIEAGKLEMERISFVINDVLENLTNVIGVKAREKGLELIFKLDLNIPRTLVGDPLRLGQILLNLANNAIKFTDTGEIVVETKLLSIEDGCAIILFNVIDTGIGLTEQQQQNLFQSFSQTDSSITRKYGGTGLGLAISKNLSEMMDGSIGVESKPGEGSCFYFTVKLGIGNTKPISLRSDLKKFHGIRVLVVDDNKTSRDVLTSYLKDFSFNVKSVESGELAIMELTKTDANEDSGYDLVLMDYLMPGINGIEASRKIRSNLASRNIPKIIMVTAFGREEIMQQAENIGLQGFLIKPVSPSMLHDAIMEVFAPETINSVHTTSEHETIIEGLDEIKGSRLLVVEDNNINQQVARELLEGEGFFVDIASNGKVAIDMLNKDSSYDLVLMDLQMPVLDGYLATREIKNNDKLSSIPIIAMTADAMKGTQEKVLKAGMDGYLTKPINQNELWQTLVKWIEPGERELPEDSLPSKERNGDEPYLKIDGVDVSSALKRIGGNRNLYKKILAQFLSEYKNLAEEVKAYLSENRTEDALRSIHTAKGVSANLGIEGYFELMVLIEEGLKENQDMSQPLLQADHMIEDISSAAETNGMFEDTDQETFPKIGWDIQTILDELTQAVNVLDKRQPKPAQEILSNLESYDFPKDLRIKLDETRKHLDNYRLKDAKKQLYEILESLKKETSL